MNKWLVFLIPLLFCQFLPQNTIGQLSPDDSLYYQAANDNILKTYHTAIKEQSDILNGRMNIPYTIRFENCTPFFKEEKFLAGELIYDGVRYERVLMMYDQLLSGIITLAPFGRLQLFNNKVDRFSIDGHNFIRLEENALNKIKSGFYEHLYDGEVDIFKRVEKTIREDLQTGVVLRFIDKKDFFFIKYGEDFHLVKTKKEILNVFKQQKPALQAYIKKNKLNFRKDMDNAIVELATYYDQLTR